MQNGQLQRSITVLPGEQAGEDLVDQPVARGDGDAVVLVKVKFLRDADGVQWSFYKKILVISLTTNWAAARCQLLKYDTNIAYRDYATC